MKCKICSTSAAYFGKTLILDKYNVSYYKCNKCGFISTEEPYWLEESYDNAITATDIGLVNRNITLSRITKLVITAFFNQNSRFLDYGGGYGLFVRLMRDQGLDFYRYDKYCTNLFAEGFEVDTSGNYEAVTAFEVFEHLVDPIQEVEEMLKYSNSIFFSTTLLPHRTPFPGDWWYYGTEHGQHISFFTEKSLAIIAKRFNLHLYTNRRSLHLLTIKSCSANLFQILTHDKIANLFAGLVKRESLIQKDYKDRLKSMK